MYDTLAVSRRSDSHVCLNDRSSSTLCGSRNRNMPFLFFFLSLLSSPPFPKASGPAFECLSSQAGEPLNTGNDWPTRHTTREATHFIDFLFFFSSLSLPHTLFPASDRLTLRASKCKGKEEDAVSNRVLYVVKQAGQWQNEKSRNPHS